MSTAYPGVQRDRRFQHGVEQLRWLFLLSMCREISSSDMYWRPHGIRAIGKNSSRKRPLADILFPSQSTTANSTRSSIARTAGAPREPKVRLHLALYLSLGHAD